MRPEIMLEALAQVARGIGVKELYYSHGAWVVEYPSGTRTSMRAGDLLLAVLERAAAMGHAVSLTWDYSAAPHAWCCTIGQGADPYVDGVPSGKEEGPLVAALLAFALLPQYQEIHDA